MSDKNSTDDIVNDNYTIKTSTTIVKNHRYDIYILDYIVSPNEYVDILNVLRTAKETDDVHFHLNSGGGWCRTALQIINTMDICKAPITCHASGLVASAATWIFLSGNHFVIENDIEFMCHYYSGGVHGKGNEIEEKVNFSTKYYHKLFKKIYKGFLSKNEIKALIGGTDFWFSQKEVAKRLKKKYKINNDNVEKEEPNG
jgi:ATP-dependent protease ClpP protease subunit